MNQQGNSIGTAIYKLGLLKAKTNQPDITSLHAQADSFDAEKKIVLDAWDIVSNLIADLVASAIELGGIEFKKSDEKAIHDRVVIDEILFDAQDWADEVRKEVDA